VRFDISALLNPKARPLLGLDISSSAVKLVELTANGKEGYRVERYTIEVLPKDAVSDGNIANMDGVVDAVKWAPTILLLLHHLDMQMVELLMFKFRFLPGLRM
jgi:type IV pilus assembly protein PilM